MSKARALPMQSSDARDVEQDNSIPLLCIYIYHRNRPSSDEPHGLACDLRVPRNEGGRKLTDHQHRRFRMADDPRGVGA